MPLTRRQRANAALKHSVSETEITQSLMDLASVVASIPEGARAGWYRSVQRYRNAPHPVAGNHYNLSAIASQWLRVADIVWAGYPEQDAGDRRAVATAEGRLSCPSHPLRESPAPATPSGAGGGFSMAPTSGARTGAARRGKPLTATHKARIAAAQTGHDTDTPTRQRIAAALKGRPSDRGELGAQIAAKVPVHFVTVLDERAQARGLSRSELLREIIGAWIG
ncbi:MAG TPA: CopG family transcriptional regulator [Solirubrobacteraceae bacterium]|nr:CopG family transcriptional regulator [Solirubrobacteraceae bacterium]